MSKSADVIVIGLGIIGSSAAFHLAKRGLKVIAIDAFPPRHTNGASHGQSRIIRKAYYEAPDYVPLLHRAYDMWYELEEESGRKLLTLNGGLFIGPPDSELVTGSFYSAKRYDLAHEYLTAAETMQRFSAWRLPPDMVAVFEEGAGTMHAAECWDVQLQAAKQHGAELFFGERIYTWEASENSVRVVTSLAEYTAGRLVICPGPWASELLTGIKIPFEVHRVVNAFFTPKEGHAHDFSPEKFPIYCIDTGAGFYYGFPRLGDDGVKIGRHNTGTKACTPSSVNRNVEPEEIAELHSALKQYIPAAAGDLTNSVTCLYTLSPDLHFVIDFHPRHQNVVVAAGFSGHGFKFATVAGEILADLSTKGSTEHPIEFLSINRFNRSGSLAN